MIEGLVGKAVDKALGKLHIGEDAPSFAGKAYHKGKIVDLKNSDFKGKYYVLFFYPLDFTFVCPTEILAFDERTEDFEKANCKLIGCSVDSAFSHMKWCQTPLAEGGLRELQFPLLSDINKELAKSYNALIEYGENTGVTWRATFIVDGKGKLRHKSYNDLCVGRNVDEVLRLVKAFQYADENGEVCPAKWARKGDPTMKPAHDAKETSEYFRNNLGK